MSNIGTSSTELSRWPHRLACVMVCATFPLIWVGGLVTTYDAGMAVPDWPSTYGYNLFLYPLSTWLWGPWDLFIEHGHRLLASVVGLLTMGFVYVVWRLDSRRWMRGYALACLALVIGQGVLGGMRVLLDANLLARLHGCVGPLYFVSTIFAMAFTSKWWGATAPRVAPGGDRVVLLATTTGVAYLQLVLGAHLRHMNPSWPPTVFRAIVIAHIAVAFLLLGHAVSVSIRSRATSIRHLGHALLALVMFQFLIGMGAWRVKYYFPTWMPQPEFLRNYAVTAESMVQTMVVTAHVAMGSLIVGTAAYLTAQTGRAFFTSRRPVMSQASATVQNDGVRKTPCLEVIA